MLRSSAFNFDDCIARCRTFQSLQKVFSCPFLGNPSPGAGGEGWAGNIWFLSLGYHRLVSFVLQFLQIELGSTHCMCVFVGMFGFSSMAVLRVIPIIVYEEDASFMVCSISSHKCSTTFPLYWWWASGLFPVFAYYEESCYKSSH